MRKVETSSGAVAHAPGEMPGPEVRRRMEVPVLTGTGAIRARQVREALNTGNFGSVTFASGKGRRGKFSDVLNEEDQAYFRQIWSSATSTQRAEFMRQMSIFFDDEHAGAGGGGLRRMAAIVDKMREQGATLAQFADYSRRAGVRVTAARAGRRRVAETVPTPVAPVEEAPSVAEEAPPVGEAPAPTEAAAYTVRVDWDDARVSGIPEERRTAYEKFIEKVAAEGMRITDPMALIVQLERVASGRTAVLNMPANQNAAVRWRDEQKFNEIFASVGLELMVRENWTGERYTLALIGRRRAAPVEEAPSVAEEAPPVGEAPAPTEAAAYTYEKFIQLAVRVEELVPVEMGISLTDPALFDIPGKGEELLAIYREIRDHFADLEALLADPTLEMWKKRRLDSIRAAVNNALTLAGA